MSSWSYTRSMLATAWTHRGTYLVCEEFYWGTQRENIGMEYYFWIEVSEEYLASEGAE